MKLLTMIKNNIKYSKYRKLNLPNLPRGYTNYDLYKAIDSFKIPKDLIDAIIFFGSAVREPIYKRISHNIIVNYKSIKDDSVIWENKPNDIDVLIILKNNAVISKKEESHILIERLEEYKNKGTSYSPWWVKIGKHYRHFHIFVSNLNMFEASLYKDETEALSILMEGVLFKGKFKYEIRKIENVYCDPKRLFINYSKKSYISIPETTVNLSFLRYLLGCPKGIVRKS